MMKSSKGPGSSGGRGHLRDWDSKSYGKDGRASSAIFDEGQSNQGWTRARDVSDHIETSRASGVHGAPSLVTRTARCTQGPQPKPMKD